MATRTESRNTASLATDRPRHYMGARVLPVSTAPTITMSAPTESSGDPMDTGSPTGGRVIPKMESETNGRNGGSARESAADQLANAPSSMPAPPPAAAAVHQPKIVQTAFIHKLYNMLEDPNIQHLISWSTSAESFIMSPSADFSKVLSQYFKHTNISSFVRQLNMYGFHKERDVFHTGSPEQTLWEFKHGNGNFKRGDLAGLREIKRRASRHSLVHRESNYHPKPSASQPGTPAEIAPPPQSGNVDARLLGLEHSLYDLSARLERSDEAAQSAGIKNQVLMESMGRLIYFNQELSRFVLSMAPADSPMYKDVIQLQGEMYKQADALRSLDEPQDPYIGRQQYFSNVDNAPVSPRQLPQDDARRANLAVPGARGQNMARPPVPSSLYVSTRRAYGSIGGTSPQSSPSRGTGAQPPPPGPHPLSNVELPPGALGRRHTAADIRAHGWQPGAPPLSNTTPTTPWPSSPSRVVTEDQRIRDSFSNFSLQTPSQHPASQSRPTTPPSMNGLNSGAEPFGGWSFPAASRDGRFMDSSAPPTRRGSMAHILNPSETVERPEEEELDERGEDDRKRKRLQ